MSDDVNERFGNVIRAEFGTASSLEEVMPLPVVLGGMAPFKCTRCSRVFSPVTWHVELAREVLCRYCAKVDPELAIWQEWADVMDAVDQMMQRAADLGERVVLAQMLERYAGHLARWRWPEDEPTGYDCRGCGRTSDGCSWSQNKDAGPGDCCTGCDHPASLV